jgi:glycyl-tRNA synthetase beta chain
MPEFFLELFSEEIPARMQQSGATLLSIAIHKSIPELVPLNQHLKTYFSPRRIAVIASVEQKTKAISRKERGPRIEAPEQAIAGFLRKFDARREQLSEENNFWVLSIEEPARDAVDIIMEKLPAELTRIPWAKSMRWGQGGDFTWVRPLRRIVCLLDGQVIPFKLGPITASNETEGHRFLSPGPFTVSSAADWEEKLEKRFVVADQTKRRKMIVDGIAEKAAELGLNVVEDPSLIDEVNGLVEWPVALIGKIDEDFMDLPPEVRELSMKVNQRYFALRDEAGEPAAYFAFVANVPGKNDVSAIVSGNERVLRARLSDARHFWDLDLEVPLSHYLEKLKNITFHGELGTQLDRANRIAERARDIAFRLGGTAEEVSLAVNAGALAKADLATGMVGEFPELQGIIGGYYAAKHPERWDGAVVSEAIRTHYLPKGPTDNVPRHLVPCAVALADKLDTLCKFFEIGEVPTGSGDPYALRRAALGVVRIILENDLRLSLRDMLPGDGSLFRFIIERLRVKLRTEGKRFDVLDAVFAINADGDLVRLMKRVDALSSFLSTDDGANLLVAYRRAANILRIEEAKTGEINGPPNPMLFDVPDERRLADMLNDLVAPLRQDILSENFIGMMDKMSQLRAPVDAFFEKVTVNTNSSNLTLNRFKILAQLRSTMHAVADFSKIEG